MSTDSQRPLVNGSSSQMSEIDKLNAQLKQTRYSKFHGDELIGDDRKPTGLLARWQNTATDLRRIFTFQNADEIQSVITKLVTGKGLDKKSVATLVGSMANDSNLRQKFVESQVKEKYERMLHPPLTYLGDAFQYRTVDGKYNSVLQPHLGQAGAPYAKTVPSKTHPLGALPDPGDLFDRLLARQEGGRVSGSGLSSMLLYHATIIIHDIFRTNDKDKNISDSSSYLDLSPLYGYTEEMQRKVRDDKYKLGLLKPDTFAEDRLLRQPPGVCIMLVMYNRYHNYAATQIRRINENGKFTIPAKFSGSKLEAVAKHFVAKKDQDKSFQETCRSYRKAWDEWMANDQEDHSDYDQAKEALESLIDKVSPKDADREKFEEMYDAAWNKLDDDLFNTARLITCGMYIQISIHDYLRGLMGFNQFDTNFTLDPRVAINNHGTVTRGIGNQVTVEFNLLYRLHCAISLRDERYTEDFMRETFGKMKGDPNFDPKEMSFPDFLQMMGASSAYKQGSKPIEPWQQEFGLQSKPEVNFKRNPITGLFDDQQMINELTKAMDEPISNFGPRNHPRCLRSVEIMGILQGRKWEIGTLNDFRDFFGMKRHESFESITPHPDVQEALRDLYEHPDKVELYPGVWCESDKNMGADPGPSDLDSALWAAIFSDAITLVRSDRFYTVDWNTNSLTSWGMKEVTQDNDILKSSVYHRLLQRAFPGWFPYNSIRFFHPFYTAQQNSKFAHEQGYAPDFRVKISPATKNVLGQATSYKYDTEGSDPNKPYKPVYLKDHEQISALLSDTSGDIIHPARSETSNLPPKIAEVLAPGRRKAAKAPHKAEEIKIDDAIMMKYFIKVMREVVKQEAVTMNNKGPVYQIDITRDFAIPVTVRYVADFLGFSDKIRTESNPKAPYTENEMYKHISNCQSFFSYNADETKLFKRRKQYRASMKFLYDLTTGGTIYEVTRWNITRWVSYLFSGFKSSNPMTELGMKICQRILETESDSGKAAALFLLIALDAAFNSVLAFTSILSSYMRDLYRLADPTDKEITQSCDWLKVQQIAFDDSPQGVQTLEKMVLDAEKRSVRLPIIRKATASREIKDASGKVLFTVEKGQTIICDIYNAKNSASTTAFVEDEYLSYQSSFTNELAEYHPKHIAMLSLTAMIKTVAQMKNVRRGHDTQGRLKKINLDSSTEGYANYMAPMRMKKIERDVEKSKSGAAKKVYNKEILKPSIDTYLTPEWDEFVPFPTTWKLRFDGFGTSDYGGPKLPSLIRGTVPLPDDFPPFYQPQGASHLGGTFADVACVCATPGVACQCKSGMSASADHEGENGYVKVHMPADKIATSVAGCGVPGEGLYNAGG